MTASKLKNEIMECVAIALENAAGVSFPAMVDYTRLTYVAANVRQITVICDIVDVTSRTVRLFLVFQLPLLFILDPFQSFKVSPSNKNKWRNVNLLFHS
jgi:hypothetical protein